MYTSTKEVLMNKACFLQTLYSVSQFKTFSLGLEDRGLLKMLSSSRAYCLRIPEIFSPTGQLKAHKLDQETINIIAVREAAYALVAYYSKFGIPLNKTSILMRGNNIGLVG